MELPKGDRYYFHSTPRTASTVFQRILNLGEQPNLNHTPTDGYFLIGYFMTQRKLGIQGKHPSTWTEDQKSQLKTSLHESFEKFSQFLQETDEKGQRCFIKEHCNFVFDPAAFAAVLAPDSQFQSTFRENLPILPRSVGKQTWSAENQTVFPDQFLQTWKPTILIRHPALVFPSQYRAFSDIERILEDNNNWEMTMTLKWARNLYSLYANVILKNAAHNENGIWPIVLESDTTLSNPALIEKYCKLVGLDVGKLKFTWDVAAEDDRLKSNPVAARMSDTLIASTGLLKGKLATGIDIDVEAGKWREEFGEKVGREMENWVRDAMPDYEWLKAKSLRE